MNYFCAQCQKRHPVRDIAADLREISRDEITEQLGMLFDVDVDQESYYERLALSNNLKRFVNNESLSGKHFLFKSYEIGNYLQNMQRNGMVLSGRLCLTLGWLVEKYKESGAYQADQESSTMLNPDELSAREKTTSIFDKEIKFYFEQVENEEIFNYMTDELDDPFTNDFQEMRGFQRTCPHCGYHVSRAVGRAEEVVIALAGSPRSGKSSCLVSIASALAAGRYASLGLSLESLNHDTTWEELKAEIELYNKGYAVTKTPLGIKAVPSYSLLVKCFKRKRVLTFVDMPGEFWETGGGLSPEFFKRYAGIYCNLDCIWFFISKMTAYAIDLGDGSEEWQRDLILKSSEDGSTIKNSNASNLNANLRSLKEHLSAYNQQIPPVAVILSKAEMELSGDDVQNCETYGLFPVKDNALITDDIVAHNMQEMGMLIKPKAGRPQDRIFNELDYFYRANQIREFFRAVNPAFSNAIEDNCPYRTYISIAAYGHPASMRTDSNELYTKAYEQEDHTENNLPPTPYHEMLPLLWTLAIMGAMEIELRCVWRWKTFLGKYDTREGVVNLDAFRYNQLLGKEPAVKPGSPEEDKWIAKKSVGENLLMSQAKDNTLQFSKTTFLHKG